MRVALGLIILILLAACAGKQATQLDITLVPAAEARPTSSLVDPLQRKGQEVYNLVCAHCHGYNMEGQLAESVDDTLALGMHLVPSLGSQGHVWQHPDQLIERVIREGIRNPLDQYPMVAFDEELTDREISAVIAYIKMWWTEDQRRHQSALTRAWDERMRGLGLQP